MHRATTAKNYPGGDTKQYTPEFELLVVSSDAWAVVGILFCHRGFGAFKISIPMNAGYQGCYCDHRLRASSCEAVGFVELMLRLTAQFLIGWLIASGGQHDEG